MALTRSPLAYRPESRSGTQGRGTALYGARAGLVRLQAVESRTEPLRDSYRPSLGKLQALERPGYPRLIFDLKGGVGGHDPKTIPQKNKVLSIRQRLFFTLFLSCRFKLFQSCRYIIHVEVPEYRADPVR